jgi:hypothetical protein
MISLPKNTFSSFDWHCHLRHTLFVRSTFLVSPLNHVFIFYTSSQRIIVA